MPRYTVVNVQHSGVALSLGTVTTRVSRPWDADPPTCPRGGGWRGVQGSDPGVMWGVTVGQYDGITSAVWLTSMYYASDSCDSSVEVRL